MARQRSEKWGSAGLGDGKPHPVDVRVGNRVRIHRLLAGMNQTALANALGLTLQQVQKHEKGISRIMASRLKMMSDVLGVPISFFFIGLEPGAEPSVDEKLEQAETLELIRFYYAMPEAARRQFFEMLKSAAGARRPD